MTGKCILVLLIAICLNICLCAATSNDQPPVADELGRPHTKVKVPQLSDEEDVMYGSRFLTDDLRCDGCLAIAYQFHNSFQKKHKNRPSNLGDLPDHEIIEVAGKQI